MSEIIIADHWQFLKNYTDARVALGRTGHSILTNELLKFQLDHARAKDAVYSQMNTFHIQSQLSELQLDNLLLHSQADNRQVYLKRPDLGRKLNEKSKQLIEDWAAQSNDSNTSQSFDLAICIVDGLSAQALDTNAIAFLNAFLPIAKKEGWSLAPIALVNQGRVAIGDDIAYAMKAEIAVVMIGERPGLSSPDSMGIYLTYKPMPGFTDEKRNCISNIRPKGLNYERAVDNLYYLIKASKALQLSGVNLKEGSFISSL